MRTARESPPPPGGRGNSNTPIYDALYAEYRRLFRSLPGDRSGEESLRFEGFGTLYGTSATSSWHTERRRRNTTLPAALPPARDDRRGDPED